MSEKEINERALRLLKESIQYLIWYQEDLDEPFIRTGGRYPDDRLRDLIEDVDEFLNRNTRKSRDRFSELAEERFEKTPLLPFDD